MGYIRELWYTGGVFPQGINPITLKGECKRVDISIYVKNYQESGIKYGMKNITILFKNISETLLMTSQYVFVEKPNYFFYKTFSFSSHWIYSIWKTHPVYSGIIFDLIFFCDFMSYIIYSVIQKVGMKVETFPLSFFSKKNFTATLGDCWKTKKFYMKSDDIISSICQIIK